MTGKKRKQKRGEKSAIGGVFRQLGLPQGDRDPSSLRASWFGPPASQEPSGVGYRTVLTNGTNRVLADAELE